MSEEKKCTCLFGDPVLGLKRSCPVHGLPPMIGAEEVKLTVIINHVISSIQEMDDIFNLTIPPEEKLLKAQNYLNNILKELKNRI